MPRANYPSNRGAVYSVPGPLYSRGEHRTEPLPPLPRTVETEMHIRRHANPIPTPAAPVLTDAVCLLRQQNELLMELLCAVNSLTAATLAARQGA